MKKIVFAPEVSDIPSLLDVMSRASWYFYPYRHEIKKIVFLVTDLKPPQAFVAPDVFDPVVTAYAQEMAPLFECVDLTSVSAESPNHIIKDADIVMRWNTNAETQYAPVRTLIAQALEKKRQYEVDTINARMEGSFYLWAGLNSFCDREKLIEENRQRFSEFLNSVPSRQRAYVFGTGPSLSNFAATHDFSDGHTIVSNSMVINHQLLKRLQPTAIIAADPIFHAGVSQYAAAFRADLTRALSDHDCYFITSLRDYRIFHSSLPSNLHHKIIGVPFDSESAFNPNLAERFYVKPLANILTLLMLPVAGALSKEIMIAGCDGRPLAEDKYFWGHDKAVQINDKMENIQQVHPGFFNIAYNDYYNEHCENVGIALQALERQGCAVSSLTPSHIPALKARELKNQRADASQPRSEAETPGDIRRFIILDPDGINQSGHFLAYDTHVWAAAEKAGLDFLLFARKEVQLSALPSELDVVPCLNVHSWALTLRGKQNAKSASLQFIAEVEDGLDRVDPQGEDETLIYLYCGSLDHAAALFALIQKRRRLRVTVNLFYQPFVPSYTDQYRNFWRPFIAKAFDHSRFKMTAPTEAVREDIARHFGVVLEVAPHPSTTFNDQSASNLANRAPHELVDKPIVLFPGGVRFEKGFALTVAAAELLAPSKDVEILVRANRDNADPNAQKLLDELRETSAIINDDELGEEEFVEFLERGDIIVCPYLASHFASRTSGLVIDAMLIGRPVVALKGTWLGELAEAEGFGVAANASPHALARAIVEVVRNHAQFAANAVKARRRYLQSHSWEKLIEHIISPSHTPTDSVDDRQITRSDLDRAVAELPSNLRSAIFLPTEKIPLAEQVRGVRSVVELYDKELDGVYRPKLRKLREQNSKKRCVIIGNGPSLERTELNRLKNVDTFATNGFFLKLPELEWSPTYYVVEDHLVAEDRAEEINKLRGFTKLFPATLRYVLEPDPDTIFFDHRPRKSYPEGFDFSFGADENTYAGGTVTFTCMQLAAYLGYKEIILVGVDADYKIPTDATLSGGGHVKEIDMGSDDPNHFHPDYFGKGKRWHEPNVDIMLQAYEEAKRACDGRGVEIVNATRGGKLEVFPRVDYYSLFKPLTYKPRILLFDMTRIGDGTATGEIKSTLFSGWPEDRFLQIYDTGEGDIRALQGRNAKASDSSECSNEEKADALIKSFDPEIVVYRPTPGSPVLHSMAMRAIRRLNKPVIAWIMDDWPTAYMSENPRAAEPLEADWRKLIAMSAARLCISDAMATAFSERYGAEFTVVANGIDPAEWSRLSLKTEPPVIVRYAGSLADNMTLATIRLVAKAIERLANQGVDIQFEIKTRELWRKHAEPHFKHLSRTSLIVADLSPKEYRTWLAQADVTVIGYNFDEWSKDYTRFSIANKLPETLASGAALLAVGPADLATMQMLEKLDCGLRVTTNSIDDVVAALSELAKSPARRFGLAHHARQVAFRQFNIVEARKKFVETLSAASVDKRTPKLHTTEEARSVGAHVDETAVVAHMLSERRGSNHVMIDVGAHVGTSASYFEKLNWTIHCFEPDPENRARLEKRYDSVKTVTIDPRAVSDEPKTGVPFFTSQESTGISGFSAFRDTHKETSQVDVTTIEEIIRERNISHIDFLKVDVEGFDFSVLKGVPWDIVVPDIIECEFEDAKTKPMGHVWQDIARYLTEKGYAVYISEWHPIIRYGIPHDWRRVVSFTENAAVAANAWGNLLAFKQDPGLDAVQSAFSALVNHRNLSSSAPDRTRPPEEALKTRPNQKAPLNAASRRPHEAQFDPSASRPFYAAYAERLQRRSPRLFALARLGRRALAAAWRRRFLIAPAAFIFALIFGVGLLQEELEKRILISGGAVFLGVFMLILYLASWSYHRIRALSMETGDLRVTLSRRLDEERTKIELKQRMEREDLARRLEILVRQESRRLNRRMLDHDSSLNSLDKQMSGLIAQTDNILSKLMTQTQLSGEFEHALAEIEEALDSLESDLEVAFKEKSESARRVEELQRKNKEQAEAIRTVIGERTSPGQQINDLEARISVISRLLSEVASDESVTLEQKLSEILDYKNKLAEFSRIEGDAAQAEQKRKLSENNLLALQEKYKQLAAKSEAQEARLQEIYLNVKAARERIDALKTES